MKIILVLSLISSFIFSQDIKLMPSLNLTEQEKKFIKNNTIKIGVEQWAPVIYSNTGTDIDGITGDVLKEVVKNLGLKIEIINDLWDPLLKGLKDKKIDLLPATYYTDERATYGLYTKGFFKMLDYIYIKDDNSDIRSLSDLKGKTLAIPKGFGTIPKIRKKFPEIKIVETKDLSDSINKVLLGDVEALYDGQIAVEYKIQEDLITGLKGIPQNDFKAAKIHFFIRDDKPILKSILQKDLDSVSKEEINKIKSKWIIQHQNKQVTTIENKAHEISFVGLMTLEEILFSLFIASLLGYIGYVYYKKSNILSIRFKTFNIVIIAFELSIVSFLVFEVITLDRTENALVKMEKDKLSMIQVSDELRQSSDDLTHFARSYTVTNDKKFEQMYLDTLKIRNGKKLRPKDYGSIYWDLDKQTREERHPFEKRIALRKMIEALPFSKTEIAKLKESEDNSNDLVNLEIRAFEAMKNNNQELAIKLLHSNEYYQAKHKIMLPIDEMLSSLHTRTTSEVLMLEQKIQNQFTYILIISLLFILGNVVVYILLRKKVNIPIEYLTQTIDKIQNNEKNIEKKTFYNDEIGETIEQFFLMQKQIDTQTKDLKKQLRVVKIAERKQEQLLKEIDDEKIFIDTIMNSQENFVITSDGKCLKTANKAFFDFYDVEDTKEFIEKFGNCICDTFDTTAPKEYLQKMMGEEKWLEYVNNKPDKIHKAIIKKEGKDYIFTITSEKLTIKCEEIKTAIFTDVTKMEKAQKEIELILANILLPVLITSKEKRKILYANKYAEQQYEKSLDEIIGSDIDDTYTIQGQQQHIIDAIKKYGFIENSEEIFKTSTGKEFTALLSVTPINYHDEECYIGMVTDITKQKEMENEVRAIHKHIRESIEYASLIQGALIPEKGIMESFFKDHFVTWVPKDTVGGDIWLFSELRDKDECLLFFIDCTGHGVPGAFVTMIVKAIEREIVANLKKHPEFEISPAIIMGYFNNTMKKLLKQETKDSLSNAGWDGGIIYYNRRTQILKFSGAETPLFYIDENQEFQTVKGTRYSVGYKKCAMDYEYKETIIPVKEGMKFYCTTDGYLDQNGGEKDFPFGKKRFGNIIKENHKESMAEQQTVFMYEMQNYESMIEDNDRNDDMTLIGFEVGEN